MDREVRSLTGLRGVAACAVVAFHYAAMPQVALLPPRALVLRGYLAVDVFFVLSGFVMAMTYAHAFLRGYDETAYRAFLVRRFARIYPLYVVTLAPFVVAIALHLLPGLDLRTCAATIVANVLLIQAAGAALSLNAPAWSISTEMVAYLLFPLLVMATLAGGRGRAAGAAVAAGGMLVVAATLGPMLQPEQHGTLDLHLETTWLPMMRCLAGFTCGLLTYRAVRMPGVMRIAARDAAAAGVLALFAVGLWAGMDDLMLYPLLPAVVLCLYANRGRVARAVGGGALHWLGRMSYAIYLLHRAVLLIVGWTLPMPGWTSAVVVVGSLLVLAPLAHYGIELPGRRLIRGWGGEVREVAVA